MNAPEATGKKSHGTSKLSLNSEKQKSNKLHGNATIEARTTNQQEGDGLFAFCIVGLVRVKLSLPQSVFIILHLRVLCKRSTRSESFLNEMV